MTVTFLILTGLAALGDWAAVARRLFRVEYVFKPLTLILLIVAASAADLGSAKPWVIAALVFGLLGDVALMRSEDQPGQPDTAFLLGLGSFLAGHICYLAAFARHGLHPLPLIAGILVVGGAAVLTLPKVLSGARTLGGQELMAVVGAYAVMLAAMAVLAVGTAAIATAVGGVLFLISDMTIAWERFVKRLPHGALLVIVTYHFAQVLIVIGLIASF